MATNLDRKYRGQGWVHDKAVKYRSDESFTKDLIEEKEVSKKVIKPKKDKIYSFEIEYYFNQHILTNNDKKEYKIIVVEATSKSEAHDKFDKWDKERKEVIKKKYRELYPKNNNYHWFGHGVLHDPEYFIKIIDIRKAKNNFDK